MTENYNCDTEQLFPLTVTLHHEDDSCPLPQHQTWRSSKLCVFLCLQFAAAGFVRACDVL